MDLRLEYKNVAHKDEAFEHIKGHITPETMSKFNVNADFTYDKDNGEICADGKGFNLVASFYDDHVGVHIQLSLILRPLKGKILEIIKKEFSKVL